jgi:hypothetical protein
MPEDSDTAEIASVVQRFFGGFVSGPDAASRVAGLREVLLPEALVVRTCGRPETYDVDGFLAPRLALLTSGEVEDFREWPEESRTEVYGDVAQVWCTYAKSWVQDGEPHEGRGAKSIQLVRTDAGWRISAVAWDDERPLS